MSTPNAQTVLAGMALVIMGLVCGALIFHAVPEPNQQLVTFALGAISGALTVGGASKVADKMTTNTGTNVSVEKEEASA
jgi:outer membrane lipoprotein SlyB